MTNMSLFLPFIKKITALLALSAVSIFTSPPIKDAGKKDGDPPAKKQRLTPLSYPQGEFRNPLGIPIQLVANFGELRPNHYHMGLDIRTMQRENLPVYAAADGYVRRIKIEKGGFGNAIYIEHFNGYTTLYAHLNSFFPELAEYVKKVQYRTQSWEQEIDIDPELFPVKKGQFIALSGNTGASQGPHLHFEIRDTETGNNVNPLLFGFGIADRTPPSIYRLYYFDRRYSTYQSGPRAIPITGSGGHYSAPGIVSVKSPAVSFGIAAEDMITGMSAHVGIYRAEVWLDDVLQNGFTLNDFSYDETRFVNGSIDYKTRMSGGSFIQHISRLPGNQGSYFTGPNDGVIRLNDSAIHSARIVVKDAAGNTSVVSFNVRWQPAATDEMMFAANSIPMTPGKENSFETDDFKVYFSPNAFYDVMPFIHSSQPANDTRAVSALHHIADYRIPVHDSFTVQIKPTVVLSDNLKERIVMHLLSSRRTEVEKGIWVNGMVQAKFKYLGEAKLLLDTTPPRIALSGWVSGGSVRGRKSIAMAVNDNIGDVKSFNAYLDGQWLLFSRKGGAFIHTFDERTSAGTHQLKIVATDIAGNTAEKTFTFTR